MEKLGNQGVECVLSFLMGGREVVLGNGPGGPFHVD
jgi:hypothetical protein